MADSPMIGRRHGERGERVRAVRFTIGPSGLTVSPGTEGTITRADCYGVWVRWDNGSTISLLADCDEWEVVSPERESRAGWTMPRHLPGSPPADPREVCKGSRVAGYVTVLASGAWHCNYCGHVETTPVDPLDNAP